MIISMNQTESVPLAAVQTLSGYASSSNGVRFLDDHHPLDYLDVGAVGTASHALTNGTINVTTTEYNETGRGPLDPELVERFLSNRAVDSPWYHMLISMYSVLIVFGALGNTLVVIAVVRKPIMRTARNLFILNLAISDLLLCLVTMPLTLVEILTKYWPLGSCSILCKIVAMLQALCIFVSTISITAIAFDRYQVIVYPTRDSLQFVGAVTILAGIWLLALLLASPMFIYKELLSEDTPLLLQQIGLQEQIRFCIEDWPTSNGRFYYSIFSLCVQYLVPILIVSVAYFGIYNKLKNRITVVTVQASSQRKVERGRRMKRTNCLLISIAVIFGVSWLPLNFFNLYADMQRSGSGPTSNMLVIYAICHMIGMSSACSNPLLYGWLNDNFRKEFQELICRCTESTNVALNGHTTGCNVQAAAARRRRKHGADISKGELKLLGHSGAALCGGANGGDGDATGGGVSMAATDFMTGHQECGLRSAMTESVALTENPMPTEVTKLMPRPDKLNVEVACGSCRVLLECCDVIGFK
ncbi:neuropeptide F receptor isoform X1 [Drosophila pseudoobscura]|uniref:Neuropeptide F receptor isoform X1 n=2 Tax=Drosophila pseudoobscura pseudoobscura TaxID=46245 RepID=A0A6I8WF22_DROPS|nr:neuropeptide F receptor isoform X1 [Drosophila pseudoobscura]XP_033241440.1 neuropeptide F receptor isoform X1 [Drosophila pseudoobscura]XP_033241442.1 neuropeptide F receptor isoform X1 [Drosophila pseudoobscura]XP_033241446.1 neuropeptide F receptor isoform X1 [Drosophila pseudoobscura]XP_033241449.1 neuropeptide F receptor isoform X1 [Drosophila pseudoobscura]